MCSSGDLGHAERVLAVLIRDGHIYTNDFATLASIGVAPRRLLACVHIIETEHDIPLNPIRHAGRVIGYALFPEGCEPHTFVESRVPQRAAVMH